MPKSLNKVQLIGNLGKDPDTKFTQSGTAVCQFSIATSTSYKDKNGEWAERTEWHNIKIWARLAEVAQEYLHKGSKVYLEGRLETESWEKDGHKNYKTVVVVSDLIMLDGKQDSGERQERSESRSNNARSGASDSRSSTNSSPITDEDIPF